MEWTTYLSNPKLSKREKFLRIKEKAKELEETALRKEQLLMMKSPGGKGRERMVGEGVEDTLEVNEMLVDAIKAKLAILENIN